SGEKAGGIPAFFFSNTYPVHHLIHQYMTDIISLVNNGGRGIIVSLTAGDLSDLLDNAIAKAKDEILPTMVSAAQEDLLTKKEVMKKFGVCDTTLWHWRNKGYLEAVKVGRKVCYRRSEVERVIKLRVR
ncbi:MAG: helix-turn-helix domain-containing protein, partial [Duncaniella sp.]|nr:helix-turn-helix domain-containing protein [Duncaniella sp.]